MLGELALPESLQWSNVIVIQPWFSGHGHPAQSTLNLSRVIPANRVRHFLISAPEKGTECQGIASALAQHVPVRTFRGCGAKLRTNTVLALRKLLADGRNNAGKRTALLFADGDLFVVCAAVSMRLLNRFPFVAVVLLWGPELVAKHAIKRLLVRSGLKSGRLRLFLRTPELVDAWRSSFPEFANMFRLYPPVESVLPIGGLVSASTAGARSHRGATKATQLKIGVVGQIRAGKCIPQLIRTAERSSGSIRVGVYGPLFKQQPVAFLREVESNHLVHPGFLSEADMLRIAGQQDYLASLLERDSWDLRMESATFWLGIKVCTPVLCFDEGWLGRMVRETGAGIALPADSKGDEWLEGIPGTSSIEYRRCLESIRRLRVRLTREALWEDLEGNLH